jgi:hypothetical protein
MDQIAEDLITALTRMTIEPAGAKFTFIDRLAQDNDWTRAFAARTFTEYQRFLYLAATAERPITPSDQVDQVWHLHLTYSRHYWDVLCGKILGKPLHHGPTAGGEQEDARYADQYATTLNRYRQTFGEAPPADIWPASQTRFGTRYRRVEVGKHWMVPKTAGYVTIGAVALAGCTQSSGNPLFLAMLIGGIVLGTYVMARIDAATSGKKNKKNDGSGCSAGGCGSSSDNSSGGDSGCGGGGCGGGCGS